MGTSSSIRSNSSKILCNFFKKFFYIFYTRFARVKDFNKKKARIKFQEHKSALIFKRPGVAGAILQTAS